MDSCGNCAQLLRDKFHFTDSSWPLLEVVEGERRCLNWSAIKAGEWHSGRRSDNQVLRVGKLVPPQTGQDQTRAGSKYIQNECYRDFRKFFILGRRHLLDFFHHALLVGLRIEIGAYKDLQPIRRSFLSLCCGQLTHIPGNYCPANICGYSSKI
jgi:hypothetical protein